MGFIPALIAALPALASAAGSVAGSRSEAKAAEDAAEREAETARFVARQAKQASVADAKARAKWAPWAIAGGVVAVGVVAWALSRRRSE